MICDIDKLDMYGTEYLFTLAEESQRDEMYKLYMSETSRLLIELIGKFGNANIEFPRYIDFVNPGKAAKKKSMTPEEIIDEVTKNAGLEVIE